MYITVKKMMTHTTIPCIVTPVANGIVVRFTAVVVRVTMFATGVTTIFTVTLRSSTNYDTCDQL